MRQRPSFHNAPGLLTVEQNRLACAPFSRGKRPRSTLHACPFSQSWLRRDPLPVRNLSAALQEVALRSAVVAGKNREPFSEQGRRFGAQADLKLRPWEYRLYVGSGP